MSGSISVAMSGGGGGGYWAPFTAVQWQELEHQALIYKYLVAGVPVPSDLVLPIRRSLEALSASLLHHPASVGYYGKKFDPEPGRCRRTDGKKWRCSKEAFQESKYCEKHMNRGRNRSRKPVESSHSLSTDITGSGKGSYQNVSSSRSSTQSLYSITNSGSYDFGSHGSKLQMDNIPYAAINSKDLRYAQGPSVMPSEVVTNSLLKPQSNSYLQSNFNTFEPIIDPTNSILSNQQTQHHCFFNSEIDHEQQHSLLPWSKAEAEAEEEEEEEEEETWSHHGSS